MCTFAVQFRNEEANILGYGVMVTLQILVLSFLVRVRVSQLSSGCIEAIHPVFYALKVCRGAPVWLRPERWRHGGGALTDGCINPGPVIILPFLFLAVVSRIVFSFIEDVAVCTGKKLNAR